MTTSSRKERHHLLCRRRARQTARYVRVRTTTEQQQNNNRTTTEQKQNNNITGIQAVWSAAAPGRRRSHRPLTPTLRQYCETLRKSFHPEQFDTSKRMEHRISWKWTIGPVTTCERRRQFCCNWRSFINEYLKLKERKKRGLSYMMTPSHIYLRD
jgi:hypothetical protein